MCCLGFPHICLYVLFFLSLSLTLSFFFSVSVLFFLPLPVSPSLSLSAVPISVSRFLSFSLFMCVCVSLSLMSSLSLSLSLWLFGCWPVCLSIFLVLSRLALLCRLVCQSTCHHVHSSACLCLPSPPIFLVASLCGLPAP